jgi:shikimate kinase
MIIILEGPNGVGKTTLAKEICEKLEMTYEKDNRIADKNKDGYKRYLKLAKELKSNTVQDRLHLGEVVYPVLKKDKRKPLAKEHQHRIENVLNKRYALLIYCTATMDFIKNVYNTRGETFLTIKQVPKEMELFKTAVQRCKLPKLNWVPNMSETSKAIWFGNLKTIVSNMKNREAL